MSSRFPHSLAGRFRSNNRAVVRPVSLPIVWLLAALASFYLVGQEFINPEELNKTLPILLMVICAFGAFRLLHLNKDMLWSPIFWFLLTCAGYYGFGPLVYAFGDPDAVAYAQTFYHIGDAMLLRTNILNAVSILTVCLAFEVGMRWFPFLGAPTVQPVFEKVALNRFIVISLALGLFVEYVLADLIAGRFGEYAPSMLLVFGQLYNFALLLIAYSVFSGERRWRGVLIGLLIFESLHALTSFGKLGAVWTGITVFLGLYLAKPRIKYVVWAVVLGTLAYIFILSPVASYGRGEMWMIGDQSFMSRINIAKRYITSGAIFSSSEEMTPQGWWTRLNYANAQAFCIDETDAGRSQSTLSAAVFSFVPRFLWPEKPDMTLGVMFSIAVTGNPNPTARTAPGIFAEAYWNGGRWVVLVVCAYVGLLFVVFSHLAMKFVMGFDVRWLPALSNGIFMAIRPDDWFMATYVASLPLVIVQIVALHLLFPQSTAQVKPGSCTLEPYDGSEAIRSVSIRHKKGTH